MHGVDQRATLALCVVAHFDSDMCVRVKPGSHVGKHTVCTIVEGALSTGAATQL